MPVVCAFCGEKAVGVYVSHGGKFVCENCYEDGWHRCEDCGAFGYDGMRAQYSVGQNAVLCQKCLRRRLDRMEGKCDNVPSEGAGLLGAIFVYALGLVTGLMADALMRLIF